MQVKTVLLALLFSAVSFAIANADETCPPGAPSCRVLILTPSEIQTLEGPGMLFDSALWANRASMTQLIEAWKSKIASAPAGKMPPPPPVPKQEKTEHPAKEKSKE